MIRRRLLLLLAAVSAFAVLSGPSMAADKVTLTPDVRQRLLALEPLRTAPADRALFDGRPLLVVFFASW